MLKAIIVDDEAPARSELRFLLGELNQAEVVSEAASVREAIEKLKEYPCDVMFLDINMPEATGLQLAEALQHLKFPPAVVFVTAYSEFALDAFKVNAVDYLVKPVEKLSVWLMRSPACANMWFCMHVLKKPNVFPSKRAARRSLSISIRSVLSWRAMIMPIYRPTLIVTSQRSAWRSSKKRSMAMASSAFIAATSLTFLRVKEVEPQSGGTLLLTLDGVEEKIPVSRRRVSSLKKALGL